MTNHQKHSKLSTIAKITDAYVRHYRDNQQTTGYVEWVDTKGKSGRTEGAATRIGDQHWQFGQHMAALLARSERELGHKPRLETW